MYMYVLCSYVCIMHVYMYALRLFQYSTLATFSWEYFSNPARKEDHFLTHTS